jgi:NitT/TauT family transport system substrate-binding protein
MMDRPRTVRPRQAWHLLGLVGLVWMLAACSAAPSPAPAAQPQNATPAAAGANAASGAQLTPVAVRMGWKFAQGGHYAPYFLAKDKGFYADEGLDVSIAEGNGSGSTTTAIANGTDKIGVGIDAGTMASAVGQGAPVKMIAGIIKRSQIAVLSLDKNNIKKPADLVGKRVGIPPGSSQAQIWPAFLKANNLDPKSITQINIDANAMAASLLQGQIDAYLSLAFAQVPIIEAQGAKASEILFADNGANTLSEGIIASDTTIKNDADLLKRFLRATLKGYAYSMDHPDEAIQAGMKSHPEADPKVVRAHLDEVLREIKAGQTPGKPLGWETPDEWQQTVQILTDYADFKSTLPVTAYYTNDLLPAS